MSDVGQKATRARRTHNREQLIFQPDASNNIISPGQNKKIEFWRGWRFEAVFKIFIFLFTMNKSVKTGLIGIALLVCILLVILLINLEYSSPAPHETSCLQLDGQETCHSAAQNPYRYYGTKTSYHIALSNDTQLSYGDCEPQLFYLYSRHATRYPDRDEIETMAIQLPALKEKILTSYSEGKCNICKDDIEKLKLWHFKLVPDNDNKLTESGKKEAINTALRFKERFPTLLNRNYSEDAFKFEYTSRERSQTTAESFARGLFGEKRSESIDLTGHVNDATLQFHIDCKKFLKRCNDTSLDLNEVDKFINGPVRKSMVASISKRLGFDITFKDAKQMYRACVFGYALEADDSWCSVFSTSDLKVFEYDADIDDYYKDAYGNKLNYEQACPVVKNIVNILKKHKDNPNLKAVLDFSHAGAIKKVFTRFGLFEDQVPLASDTICSRQDRKWRSSFICPFNSNLALVLLQCGRDHKIAAFHNEKPIVLGGCSDMLCPIERFYAMYDPIAESCDITSMCCTCCRQ